MVWGCMSAAGTGHLNFIDGTIDKHMYPYILQKNLHASAEN